MKFFCCLLISLSFFACSEDESANFLVLEERIGTWKAQRDILEFVDDDDVVLNNEPLKYDIVSRTLTFYDSTNVQKSTHVIYDVCVDNMSVTLEDFGVGPDCMDCFIADVFVKQ